MDHDIRLHYVQVLLVLADALSFPEGPCSVPQPLMKAKDEEICADLTPWMQETFPNMVAVHRMYFCPSLNYMWLL